MTTPEPRNGDFVAYVEELQQASAARVLSSSPPAGIGHPQVGNSTSKDAEPTPLRRLEADVLVSRLASRRATASPLGPAIGVLIGIVVFLHGAVTGGVLTLLIGFGLIFWAARRLARAFRASAHHEPARTLVSEFFGKPPGT